MGERRRIRAQRLVQFDMFWGVGKMILTADDVSDLHLQIVDDVDEMKDPGSVGTADGHIRMRGRIRHIEGNVSTDEVGNRHSLARRTEADRALILIGMAARLQSREVFLVNLSSLALLVWTESAAFSRPFIPVEAEPPQSFINRLHRLRCVSLFIGILDAQDEGSTVLADEKPVEQRGARTADMKVAGGRRSESGTDGHLLIL
jgi:hypothetical protein